MVKKKIIDDDISNSTDDLIKELQKDFKQKEVEDCEFYISTGSVLLDYMISNQRDGGVPGGRLTEITGEEAAGKTLIASHIAANTQKMGGIAVYFDTEHALKKDFMQRVGVNWDKLVRPQVTTVEDVFNSIEKIITLTRTKFPNKEKPVTIIWDSIAQTPPRAEIEGDYDPSSLMGVASKAMSKGLRKLTESFDVEFVTMVFLNQLKTKFNVANKYMDPWIAPYGKAVPYAASVRVRLTAGSEIKDAIGETVGITTRAKVVKNRMGPPKRKTEFPIMFDFGVNNEQSIYDYLNGAKILEKSAGFSKIVLNGEEKKFRHSEWKKVYAENKEAIHSVLDENLIKKFDACEISDMSDGCDDIADVINEEV